MNGSFRILGSSSAGNCAFLRTENTRILIDAGFSARRIEALLASIGESVEALDAVFLTHEHNDHSCGLTGLSKRADLPVFANRDTAQAVQARLKRPANWELFTTGTRFTFRDIEIEPFAVPHDAYDPVGFAFHWGEDDLFSRRRSLGWVTDLGYITELVREQVRGLDCLVIEANYDEELLDLDTRRPWAIKQRIRGRHGHLSNDAVYELASSLGGDARWKQLYLAHLSRDCNCTRRVRRLFDALRPIRNDLEVAIVDPRGGTALAAIV